jgi:hypothetical protein
MKPIDYLICIGATLGASSVGYAEDGMRGLITGLVAGAVITGLFLWAAWMDKRRLWEWRERLGDGQCCVWGNSIYQVVARDECVVWLRGESIPVVVRVEDCWPVE